MKEACVLTADRRVYYYYYDLLLTLLFLSRWQERLARERGRDSSADLDSAGHLSDHDREIAADRQDRAE
jgi:hypothetical protein